MIRIFTKPGVFGWLARTTQEVQVRLLPLLEVTTIFGANLNEDENVFLMQNRYISWYLKKYVRWFVFVLWLARKSRQITR